MKGAKDMRKAYKVLLYVEDEGYSVYIPDFDNWTQGKDLADAIFMARDAIGIAGISLQDIGQEIPEPDSAKGDPEEKADIETYVDVDFVEYRKKQDNRKVKKNLTIPSWLNEKAEKQNINFSRTLEEALIEKLETESQ